MSSDTLTAQWLQRAQSAVNADTAFRLRGSIDVTMGVQAGSATYLVTFAGFTCHSVQTVVDGEARNANFIIAMSPERWERFLAGRRTPTGRTLVEIDTTDGIVTAQNPRKKLDFLRVHTSLQAFFDAGVAAAAAQAA